MLEKLALYLHDTLHKDKFNDNYKSIQKDSINVTVTCDTNP